MTPLEAHQILTQVTGAISLNRADTFKVLQALDALRPKPEVVSEVEPAAS